MTERNELDVPNVAERALDERLFLTAAEVGQQLGVRKSRVYELAAGGMLPVVRLGRRMLFPRRGLEQLADAAIERARARALSESPEHLR